MDIACGRFAGGTIASLPRSLTDILLGGRLKIWRENGKLPIYTRECFDEIRYPVRTHPEISIQGGYGLMGLPRDPKTSYLLIGDRSPMGENNDYWYPGMQEYMRQMGYNARLLMERPAKHPESQAWSGSLYFPPNGLWVYKISRE